MQTKSTHFRYLEGTTAAGYQPVGDTICAHHRCGGRTGHKALRRVTLCAVVYRPLNVLHKMRTTAPDRFLAICLRVRSVQYALPNADAVRDVSSHKTNLAIVMSWFRAGLFT